MSDSAMAATEIAKSSFKAATLSAADKQKIAAEKKKKRDRAKKKAKKAAQKDLPKTKVVVRRLPPTLLEEDFMKLVSPWTSDEVVDYRLYVPGKLSKSKAKQNVFSRAYFHMKAVETVIAFHQGFDGYIFGDSQGPETKAVVEFAPFQKTPKIQSNIDARQGTIDDDPDYQSFLEQLKAEESGAAESKEGSDGMAIGDRLENRLAHAAAQSLAKEQESKPKSTPLLDHLRSQKAAQLAAKAKILANKKAAATAKTIAQKNVQAQPPSDAKKASRRERDKRRKEEKKKNAAAAVAAPSGTATSLATVSSDKSPANAIINGAKPNTGTKKESKPRRPPKKSKPVDSQNKQHEKQPVKILGRKPEQSHSNTSPPNQKDS